MAGRKWLRSALIAGLFGFVAGYAMAWGTPRLFNRVRAALENEPGNTAPTD